MSRTLTARRRIKVRGGSLGAFLCWAVVFADIGTSVYYVPGILYGHFGSRSALFVLMTLFVSSFSASSTPRSRGGTPKAVASSTSPRRRFIPLPACSTPCSSSSTTT